jgi:hypothetical protein
MERDPRHLRGGYTWADHGAHCAADFDHANTLKSDRLLARFQPEGHAAQTFGLRPGVRRRSTKRSEPQIIDD